MVSPHFLKTIFLAEHFSSEELELILAQYERVTFDRNDYLIRSGETANYYFFMESGFARSYVIDLEGNDITTKFFGTTDIVIDWHAYFLKTSCRENIQAIKPCVAWKITFQNFMKLFRIEAFREVGRTRLVNHYFELKSHSIALITEPAKERYLALLRSKPEIVQNVPLKQIATYLGITDTSLSRIRNEITTSK